MQVQRGWFAAGFGAFGVSAPRAPWHSGQRQRFCFSFLLYPVQSVSPAQTVWCTVDFSTRSTEGSGNSFVMVLTVAVVVVAVRLSHLSPFSPSPPIRACLCPVCLHCSLHLTAVLCSGDHLLVGGQKGLSSPLLHTTTALAFRHFRTFFSGFSLFLLCFVSASNDAFRCMSLSE